MTALLDLPEDIIVLVLSNLPPQSYLNFCLVSKAINRGYNYEPSYWRSKTAQKFRLPISPLLHADGPRWYWLYKKLKTQTRLYTWGQGVKGNLGPARSLSLRNTRMRRPLRGFPRPLPRAPPRIVHERTSSQWPTETDIPYSLGTIVDLQCGGWSTTVLTSEGNVYTLGMIDSSDGRNVGEAATDFTRLEYLSQSTSTIRQISVGRRHVLALDDNGEILSWDRVNAKGYMIFARSGRDFGGKAKRVVAGWGDSSAYLPDIGIVYWQPVKNDQEDQMLDGVHVKERVIPDTSRRVQRIAEKDVVIEVLAHIVLEGYIVFITNESRVFACALGAADPEQTAPDTAPFEVPDYSCEGRKIKDVQGSFRSFAIFTDFGDVLAGDVDYLRRCSTTGQSATTGSGEGLATRPPDIPALQHTGVIEVAFGDHHYHALHTNGTMTSYGRESQSCGSFGLGDVNAGSWFRSVAKDPQGFRPDAYLLPIANIRGRQVWFEPEKKDWLRWMEDRRAHASHTLSQPLYSEWVEQEGRHWADGPKTPRTSVPNWGSGPEQAPTPAEAQNYHDLGAYFAISVAAAGWHSGALVLVDEPKAEKARQKWTIRRAAPSVPGEFEASLEIHEEYVWDSQKTLPHIQGLTDLGGSQDGELQVWRDGMPTLEELGLSSAQS